MILLANPMQAAGRLGPADSKSGLGAFGRLSACADRPNRAKNMSPQGDMRRNVLRPEFIRRTRAVNQQVHFIAGRARWTPLRSAKPRQMSETHTVTTCHVPPANLQTASYFHRYAVSYCSW